MEDIVAQDDWKCITGVKAESYYAPDPTMAVYYLAGKDEYQLRVYMAGTIAVAHLPSKTALLLKRALDAMIKTSEGTSGVVGEDV